MTSLTSPDDRCQWMVVSAMVLLSGTFLFLVVAIPPKTTKPSRAAEMLKSAFKPSEAKEKDQSTINKAFEDEEARSYRAPSRRSSQRSRRSRRDESEEEEQTASEGSEEEAPRAKSVRSNRSRNSRRSRREESEDDAYVRRCAY